MWLDAWTATALSGTIAVIILALRLGYRRGLRGVRGDRPTQAWAEVTYALAGTVSLAVGWSLWGDEWLAFLPIAFMAWGDSIAGFLRATRWRDNVVSLWPSVVIVGVCLITASPTSPTGSAPWGLL